MARSCQKDGRTLIANENEQSACAKDHNDNDIGGWAFTCGGDHAMSMDPWAVNDKLAFGFAAMNSYSGWKCGECYELVFDGHKHDKKPNGEPLPKMYNHPTTIGMKGKRMIVQAINSGAPGEYSDQHFDIMIPGGGTGHNTACTKQHGWHDWGEKWGGFGVNERWKCSKLPASQQKGCYWRYDWGLGWDNPSHSFRRIKCPLALVNKSGIVKN